MSHYEEFCGLFNPEEEADMDYFESVVYVRKRRPKQQVSLAVRQTEKYQERRRKNSLAAKRNRELKKKEEMNKTKSMKNV